MNTNYHSKKIITSLAMFVVMGGLISLPVLSFNAIKPVSEDNNRVLGVSTSPKTSVIDGKIRYVTSTEKMLSFEIILEPNEYYVKDIENAVGTTQIAITEGSENTYATNTNGKIEIINLSENAVLVKGVVF